MGKGALLGSGLNLHVTFEETAADISVFRDIFQRASNRLYNATDGQLFIAKVFYVDGKEGINQADIVLRKDSLQGVLGTGALNGLGVFGANINIYEFFKDQVLNDVPGARDSTAVVLVHELGHYIWGLHDEYKGPTLPGKIDFVLQQQNDLQFGEPYQTIILEPGFDIHNPETEQNFNLEFSTVVLRFGEELEELVMDAVDTFDGRIRLRHTFNNIGFAQAPYTADAPDISPPAGPDDPSVNNPSEVCVEPDAACGGQDHCIMAARGGNTSKTEFCVSANHDPNRTTAQSYHHGSEPCWDIIEDSTGLTAPELPSAGPFQSPDVDFKVLEKEERVVCVFDRSGTMLDGEKIEGARTGLYTWIASAASPHQRRGVVWFDHEIVESLGSADTGLVQFSGLTEAEQEAALTQVNSLNPRGATNIEGALDRAADMLIKDSENRGRAVLQAVVLLSDGMQHPGPAEKPLNVIPKYQEHGIQIFTVGIGSPAINDFDTLEELASDTGGRALQTNDADVGEDVVEMMFEFDGRKAVSVDNTYRDLRKDLPSTDRFRQWRTNDQRPELEEVLRAVGATSLEDLPTDEAPRFRSQSMFVEEGAQALEFAAVWKDKNTRLWLYLLDPHEKAVTTSAVTLTTASGPCEVVRMERPKPGRWVLVAVRSDPGPSFGVRFLGGIENPGLLVSGDSDKVVQVGSPCRIWARAQWVNELSGLRVFAKIFGPDGYHYAELGDDRRREPNSGEYEVSFVPSAHGRYVGQIHVIGEGRATIANPLRKMAHRQRDPNKPERFSVKTKAAPFARMVEFYFDAGTRNLKDLERGLARRYRPNVRTGKRGGKRSR